MKTGTAVKFIGTENKSAIDKTYIWDVQQLKTETLYLIQHPQGTLFTPETEKDFAGFNTNKLTPGKSYMVAYSHELIDLTAPTTNNQQPTTNVVEMITTTLPKEYFEEIKNYLASQKEQMETNKMIRMTMKKEDLAEAITYFTEMIKATENALSQPQQAVPKLFEDGIMGQEQPVVDYKQIITNNQQPTSNI